MYRTSTVRTPINYKEKIITYVIFCFLLFIICLISLIVYLGIDHPYILLYVAVGTFTACTLYSIISAIHEYCDKKNVVPNESSSLIQHV